MNRVAQFLADSKAFYLATMEDDQPRVRPFGAVAEWDGKMYICTSNTKKVFAQMLKNPKVEISAMVGDIWIRLSGKVVVDSRAEARAAMLEANPQLKEMYSADDGVFEVLYFTDATATFCSYTEAPEEVKL